MQQIQKARLGELKTPHGIIETPIFMPVELGNTVSNDSRGGKKSRCSNNF